MMKITGTFVQPLCGGDVPVMDWHYEEWDAELALMKKIGIDTIILLRQMLGPFAAYNSKYLKNLHPEMWEPSFDYLKMFLDLCEKHEMKFWVPTYTGNRLSEACAWNSGGSGFGISQLLLA